MARPAKPIATAEGHRTKKEITERNAAEKALRKSGIRVPTGLSAEQKKVARHIIKELEQSEILCSLDTYVLAQCCVAVTCLQEINERINSHKDAMLDRALLTAKEKHEKTFFRCCDELCLSPQSRAKIAAAGTAQKDESVTALKTLLEGAADDE